MPKSTNKRIIKTRSKPPTMAATRASARQAAAKASKSIREESPIGRAEKRAATVKRNGPRALPISGGGKDKESAPKKSQKSTPPQAQQALGVVMDASVTPTTQTVQEPPSVGPKGVRNPNYSLAEDLWLCKSYVHVSEDPAVGVDQSAAVFWAKIAEDFEQRRAQDLAQNPHRKLPVRLDSSLKTRWKKKLLPDTNKFMAIFKEVERQPPSGVPPGQWPGIACTLFIKKYGYEFGFLECWRYLKEKNKWQAPQEVAIAGNGDIIDASSGAPLNSSTKRPVNEVLAYSKKQRPIGRDAAKRLAAEEKRETDSIMSDLPSLTSSVQDLVASIKEKKEKKESFMEDKKKRSEKKFKLDGYFKLANMYKKIGNNAKAEEYMMKATSLLEEEDVPEEQYDNRKMPAVETKETDKPTTSDKDDTSDDDVLSAGSPESDDSLLRWETHNQKKVKITDEEIKMIEMIQFNESQAFGNESQDEAKSFSYYNKSTIPNIPSTDCCQRNCWNMLVADRGEGMFWHWREPQFDFLPLQHYVEFDDDELSERNEQRKQEDVEEEENNSSQALLSPEE